MVRVTKQQTDSKRFYILSLNYFDLTVMSIYRSYAVILSL